MQLQKGQKVKLSDLQIDKTLKIQFKALGLNIDFSCFGVDDQSKLKDDRYMVFYNQPTSPNQEIKFNQQGDTSLFDIDLSNLPQTVNKLVFTAAIDGNGDMSQLQKLELLINDASFTLTGSDFIKEKALIIAEIYQKDNIWRINAVGQGFNGGLDALLVFFGGEVAHVEQNVAPSPAPAPTSNVNLSKITLQKQGDTHKIDLSKRAPSEEIVINLNWTQKAPEKKGLLASIFSASDEIDLDLGLYYELRDSEKMVIDGLQFSQNRGGSKNERTLQGCYNNAPWIWHTGDDRSGAGNGENILINPAGLKEIKRIIVYCFIFKGAARWAETNGVVTIKVPGSPEIAVEMGSVSNKETFSAIAELLFDETGSITIKKLVTFHDGHPECDKYYNWGMKWTSGSK